MISCYQRWQRQKGIGLLELMLSLAIIAILLIMATRYYQSASVSNKINTAVDMFAGVQGAMESYAIDNDPEDATIEELSTKGFLPPSYGDGDGVNPFGGKIELTPASGYYTITMDEVPGEGGVCEKLASRVNSTIAASREEGGGIKFGVEDGGCNDTGGGTVTANYPM